MRLVLLLCLFPLPVFAWEAGTVGRLCTLSHSEDAARILLTYDPNGPLYTIALTTPAPWPAAEVFGMTFNGPSPLTISTNQHMLSDEGRTLTVTDRGFGNVLNGLEYNATAMGFSGEASVTVSLAGAAPEVAQFRACLSAPTA